MKAARAGSAVFPKMNAGGNFVGTWEQSGSRSQQYNAHSQNHYHREPSQSNVIGYLGFSDADLCNRKGEDPNNTGLDSTFLQRPKLR